MSLQALPQGTFFFKEHSESEMEVIDKVIALHSFCKDGRVRFCFLVNKDFSVSAALTVNDLENVSPIDHPFMVLAQKFASQAIVNNV